MRKGLKWLTIVTITAIILFLFMAKWFANLYLDWLWFGSLGYASIFKTILLSEIGLRVLVGLSAFLFIFINLLFTRKYVLQAISSRQYFESEDVINLYQSPVSKYLTPRLLTVTYLAISAVLGLFISTAITGDWVIIQKFINATAFGLSDPIFNQDIGYYVFKLPFYQFIYRLVTWFIIIAAFSIGLVYFISETGRNGLGKLFNSIGARVHFSFLAVLFFLARAWGFRLEQYMLLYSNTGVVFGPGYTDIHARLVAFKALLLISIAVAIIILINLFMRKFRLVLYSIGILLLASIILGGVYPALIQSLLVKPNELNRESPYIANSIKYTRLAYGLDKVATKPFPAGNVLSGQDIENSQGIINNIRLWDWRPLTQTYGQLQEIRPYYDLKNIDIDRYKIDNQYRQVMLAARELDQKQLPEQAQTWINMRLKYTHGYGIAMNPVNEMTSEGLPNFFIQNIPPASSINKKVARPEVYFGELTDSYVIVNTKTKEFDYPIGGNENAYSTYRGSYGVKTGGLFRRAIFALAFADYKILLATDLQNSSQFLYYRNIKERVPRKLAPFLSFDSDPYIVLDDAGNLQWMWDAYTTSDMYPYSEPFNNNANYIRNSVKVVINAYTGQVDFYVSDKTDPVIKTYEKIFPGVFKPIEQMPGDLKKHIRYPVDLFNIQAQKYAVYHMTDTEMFYNQEDKWNLPTEKFFDQEENMEPYYTITRLPDGTNPEYVLILPFTPKNKTNMIAWMAARSDAPNYGDLLVYEFPKQQLVYGPMQIEARIDQDTTISQQLTLWNQRGSSVIRGNLLVIPVKNSLLYVEPIYLQAEQSKMPELRRVVVAHGDKVVMEPTLDMALNKIFGTPVKTGQESVATEPRTDQTNTIQELINQANDLYNQAQDRLKNGDWAGYGEAISKLKEVLGAMSESVKQ
ncbi:UPF0182 family membrane protein [Desulfotruncus alcoholivorax]|uniref:UPF0182 family membrane protein n=1 Tax=Desulfotruncus alcoholivorax TaxID=265477 RepID=UPI00041B33E2|nr:UPF0182 family protein [Desulfotruncus alcoholivorax]